MPADQNTIYLSLNNNGFYQLSPNKPFYKCKELELTHYLQTSTILTLNIWFINMCIYIHIQNNIQSYYEYLAYRLHKITFLG